MLLRNSGLIVVNIKYPCSVDSHFPLSGFLPHDPYREMMVCPVEPHIYDMRVEEEPVKLFNLN